MDRRTRRLAGRLREHGVGAESVVALALGRTVATVIAVLAVQRAGGAYLPVDPDYPPDRIRLLFDDAAPVLVVADDGAVTLTGLRYATVGAGDPALRRDVAELLAATAAVAGARRAVAAAVDVLDATTVGGALVQTGEEAGVE